ncbi:cell division control protein, putative [Ricinus communis]|uniref:non-specific serine/threonine protein kinase n=1 Tax=Ricinus communis TaxID=3988 RepID=B9T0M1_RICCO|nr:cell division control protein, putative [Ricinus communis]
MLIHRPKTELTLLDSLSTTESNSDLQKAWHLLSLLLSIGHLTSPHELASLCTLFPTTPDLVEFLCSIPHSPLTLTTGNEGILVTISVIGLLAFCRFASNFNLADAFLTPIRDHSPGKLMTDAVRVYFRKRKRIQFDSLEVDKKLISVSGSAKRVRNDSSKVDFVQVHFHVTEHIRSMYVEPSFMSIKLNNIILPPNLFIKAIANKIIYQLEENVEQVEDEMDKHMILVRNGNMDPELDEESACQRIMLDSTMDIDDISFKDGFGQTSIVSLSCANADDACNAENDCFIAKIGVQCREFLTDSANMKEVESLLQPINTALLGASRESESKRKKETTSLDKERLTSDARKQTISPSTQLESVGQKQLSRPSAKMKLTFLDAISLREKATEQFSEGSKAVTTLKENLQVKRNIMAISTGQKPKQKHVNAHIKEGKKDLASFSPTDQVQTKALPCFESYIVEEEEGSGPHENAHRHHVSNELRMLERFGGKNYIIKLEGCLKSGNSDCFVLEHIEHDRPELLKKDIDLSQLRWYGYCMFRALASLHKQGIVHRDVKPGNFLFSRKSNKGHLIDFNLAMVNAKPKKEGPCVGTKGFRAPEVLFRSTYQGPKIDIWSAGVTLLYLMIGRTPFYGDPEQNIKDIAKLKGSEDLWEVAKLHDRESSFPAELYDKYLPSVTLREWCKINTKRRDFYDIIPNSLIDLVNKCLTVNPRLRISAEDALKHEFFAPCHEGPRKQRPLRQELSLDSGASLPLCEQSIENGVTVKISHQLT